MMIGFIFLAFAALILSSLIAHSSRGGVLSYLVSRLLSDRDVPPLQIYTQKRSDLQIFFDTLLYFGGMVVLFACSVLIVEIYRLFTNYY